MGRREKILAIAIGLAATAFVLYMAVDKLVLSKVDGLRKQEANLQKQMALNEARRDEYERQASRLPGLLDRTFGSDENIASSRVQTRLTKLLNTSGLKILLTSQGGPKVQGKYKEISWQVVAQDGKLEQIINFMFLLNSEPYLHHVEGLSLTPKHRRGTMDMKLRFVTIVPARRGADEILPGEAAQAPPDLKALQTEHRRQYDVIASRDPFRPYVKRPEPVKPTPPPEPVADKAPPPPPAIRQKVVSLASWAGQQEVHVRDIKTGKTDVLKPGQDLAGGKIVMIDYRRMPMPGSPELLSASRVILQKGQDYWAIELGQETGASRKLAPGNLPEELSAEKVN